MKYAVVYVKCAASWGAYVPDLPGCIAQGDTQESTHRNLHYAILRHFKILRPCGLPIPERTSPVGKVENPEGLDRVAPYQKYCPSTR